MNKSSLGLFASFAQTLIQLFRMLTKTFGVVENAVNMASASVEIAAEEQTIELTLRREDMQQRLVDAAALKKAEQEEVMQRYGSKSEEHKQMLSIIRKNLQDKVNQALLHRKVE